MEQVCALEKGEITILTSLPKKFDTNSYPVIAIVDANGRVVLARDPFLTKEWILGVSPIRTFPTPYSGTIIQKT